MKRYQFRLEAVRKMRAMHEETCRNELGLLMVERQNILNQIESLTQDIKAAYVEQEVHLVTGMKASHAAYFPQAVAGREGQIKLLQKNLEMADARISDKKIELAQKRADLKLMENLREKDHAAWKNAYAKEENLKVDEMVQMWSESRKDQGETR
ncbi:MAG: flagellar export protein FliJ [Bacteriovoracia bacterium]